MKTTITLMLLGLMVPLATAGANPWRRGTVPTAPGNPGTWSRGPAPAATQSAPRATLGPAGKSRNFGAYPPLAGDRSPGSAPSLYAPPDGLQRRRPPQFQRPPVRGPRPPRSAMAPCRCADPTYRPGRGIGGYPQAWGVGGHPGALGYGPFAGPGFVGPFGVPGVYGAPGIYGGPPGYGGFYGAPIGAPWGLGPYGIR